MESRLNAKIDSVAKNPGDEIDAVAADPAEHRRDTQDHIGGVPSEGGWVSTWGADDAGTARKDGSPFLLGGVEASSAQFRVN